MGKAAAAKGGAHRGQQVAHALRARVPDEGAVARLQVGVVHIGATRRDEEDARGLGMPQEPAHKPQAPAQFSAK